MLSFVDQPTGLILFRLPIGRQLALTKAVPSDRFQVRTLSEFSELGLALTSLDDAVVIVELSLLQAEERRELVKAVTNGSVRPWLLALSVASLHETALEDWLEAGIDWFIGPDEPAALLSRSLCRWQDAFVSERENAFLRAAVQAVPTGIVVADFQRDGQPLVYVNDTFERITGYSRQEVLGRNCRFLQNGLLAQPATDEIRRALAAQEPTHVKLYNRRKDGGVFVNELQLTPFHDRHGRMTHYIGVQRDVTLRESAMQRLEASPLKLWQVDHLLRTEFVNAAWADVFPDPEVLPPPDVCASVHPADVPVLRETLNRALRTGRPAGQEARLVLPSGEARWHHFHVAPRRADDGQVFGLIGSVVDVSTARSNEERTARRLQQLSLQSLLMRSLLGGAIIDPASASQALEIVGEMLGAEELAIVGLEAGVDSIIQLRRHWVAGEGPGTLPDSLHGRRLKEAIPFSAVRLLYADSAMVLDRAESKRFAGQGAMLAFSLRRDGQVVGCLFAISATPPDDWERESAEQLKSVSSLLHFAC